MRVRVHRQRVQLVNRDAGFPVPAKISAGRQIPVDNRAKVRGTKKLKHRDVGQRVTTMRRRVDEARPARRKQQVARPQITVNAGQRRIFILSQQRIACLLDSNETFPTHIPPPMRLDRKR